MRMKPSLIVLVLTFLVAGALVYSDEAVLIDFSLLGADVAIGDSQGPTDNEATMIDFSDVAGSTFSEDELNLMKTSLALDNWEVVLASSSRTVENQDLSMVRELITKSDARSFGGDEMADRTIMGVRVHFPEAPFNSWALVRPPFEIPAYADKTEFDGVALTVPPVEEGAGTKFDGYGVVKNVGVLKTISITVYGSNFPHGLGLNLMNEKGEEKHIFMGYMDFEGWRTITWSNPHYIESVRNRELGRYPLYPTSYPFVKLIGIMIYKDASQAGGDVITYIKDLKVTYDRAIVDVQRDIAEENIWGIIKARQQRNKASAFRKLGERQVLRYYEKLRMHQEAETPK